MIDLLAHFITAGLKPCGCCEGRGTHPDGSECDRCDGSGRMHDDDPRRWPYCPGRGDDEPAPKRRHWREPKTAGTAEYSAGRMRVRDLNRPGEGRLSEREYSQRELTSDVKRHGVQQPLAVEHFPIHPATVFNGLHRLDAAERAGVHDVPVVVRHRPGDPPPMTEHRPATEAEFNDVYDLERAGRWRGGKTAILHGPDELPPEPGTHPIPEGHVRLWHYTSADNVPSIREHGLQRKFARGDSGTGDLSEPSAGMWASTKRPDDLLDDHTGNAAVVEYHAHPDEISGHAESPWHAKLKEGGYDQAKLHEWAGGYHHVIMHGDVHPHQILGIHEGWHGAARYMKHDDPSLKSYQWIHDESKEPWNDHLKPYRRGLEALERERGQRHEGARKRAVTTTLTGDQPYHHVTMRPGPITSLPASAHGESGPGVYLAKDRAYADDMASWHPASRALKVTVHAGAGLHLLDRTKPGGEEEYRRIQEHDNGGKNEGMDRALGKHGYHGVHYLSPGNKYPETVIHDPSRLTVSEPPGQHEGARVRNFTNWDDALSELRYRKRKEPLMHRGMAIELPPDVHDFVHDQFQSRDQQARAIVRHLSGKPLGMHWAAENEQTSRHFAEWHKKNALPGSTKVILHAALPESSEHIETDPEKLRQGGVLRHDSWSSEREIPMKEGAPVNIKAVTWYGYGNRKRTGHLWGEEHTAASSGWSYDTNIVGQVTAHGPAGQHDTFYTRGSGLTHVRHPEDVPAPLYHGSRNQVPVGGHVEPGHAGNFVSRMTHTYATEQAEPDEGYKGARGYGQHVHEVKPTGWYGHRRDARGIEWASSDPWEVVRHVPRPGRHEAVLPMPGYRNPHTGGDEWFHGTRAHPEELSEHGMTDPMEMDQGAYEQPESETEGTHWNALLGTHFTADHDVAKEFALGEHSSGANQRGGDDPWRGESRNVLHARLGMHNPKVYASEHDMDHEAYEHEHAAGNHPSKHIPVGSNDEDERYEMEDMWNTADRLHRQYKNRKIPRSAMEGAFSGESVPHPVRGQWINTHPDKHGIASRFRDRLKAQGHDGIIYGNEYERSHHGEQANKSAIVFHPHQIQITQHHGAYEDHLSAEQGEHQQARLPGAGQMHLPFERASARVHVGTVPWITAPWATTAAWTPSDRIFGPTYGLDHRLFDGERLRPAVRDVLMGRLSGVLRAVLGPDWDVLTHVYLAGSQASKWTGPDLEGNGDLDILIGLAHTHARLASPSLSALSDADIERHLNTILRARFNESHWHPPFDPAGKEYDLTGYVIHVSDIRSINPYAAYDLTEDGWAVKPPDMPSWTAEQFPQGPAVFAEARALASQVRAILRLPEPFRRQEAERIWDYIHSGRNADFTEHGLGWMGTGNVLEKALDQASGKLVEKLKQAVYEPSAAPLALAHGMTTADLGSRHD